MNILLGDGATRFVNDNIASVTWASLATIDTGEVIGDY